MEWQGTDRPGRGSRAPSQPERSGPPACRSAPAARILTTAPSKQQPQPEQRMKCGTDGGKGPTRHTAVTGRPEPPKAAGEVHIRAPPAPAGDRGAACRPGRRHCWRRQCSDEAQHVPCDQGSAGNGEPRTHTCGAPDVLGLPHLALPDEISGSTTVGKTSTPDSLYFGTN